MCGIFGIIATKQSPLSKDDLRRMTKRLFLLSESRGKEASGIAFKDDRQIIVLKRDVRARKFIKQPEYQQAWEKTSERPKAIIGHSRLVTNGVEDVGTNNQPVIKDGIVGIHNGIIVNVDKLWQKHSDLKRSYEVDTEVLLSLFRKNLKGSAQAVVRETLREIEGTVSTAMLLDDQEFTPLFTNNGSLYYLVDTTLSVLVFASERYILEQFCRKESFAKGSIKKVEPSQALFVHEDLLIERESEKTPITKKKTVPIRELSPKKELRKKRNTTSINEQQFMKSFEQLQTRILKLRKCSKCILPETFPNIRFDEKGVCNYCHNYSHIKVDGEKKLKQAVKGIKKNKSGYDCIVAFSGGRDSSYALHYIKNVLGLKPLAYTYDWGMVTDLARRNQARICGKLGVEHILISADIKQKRKNIRRNVLAWLKKPDLGMVPLFMAGDKQYFYYLHKLRKQTGIELLFMGENLLERTEFKYGFCNVKKKNSDEHTYTLSTSNKIQMLWYYTKNFFKNPAYLNRSLLDTAGAYAAYYLLKHDFINIYQYVRWDEEKINTVLHEEYDWELSPDTTTTWRIGDGTASFYNYIYYVMAGFSEFDTFLSNQIREGQMDRKKALELSERYNKPRYASMQWYADTVGFDLGRALDSINKTRKLY